MISYPVRFTALAGWAIALGSLAYAAEPAPQLKLDEATQARCLSVLKEALKSDEFWPSMHASEALTQAGHGAEVQAALKPKLPKETDDQKRCGLARELSRAGDLSYVQLLLDILGSSNPHGHIHASESLFKISQIGDGVKLRKALSADRTAQAGDDGGRRTRAGGNREAAQPGSASM